MKIAIVSPVRIFGHGIRHFLDGQDDMSVAAVCEDFVAVRASLDAEMVDVLLVDISNLPDFEEVRDLATAFPDTVFVAIGLREQRQTVIRCGHAGFSGYATREASGESLVKTIRDAQAGRLACPEHISGGLLKALFRSAPSVPEGTEVLTRRETDVLRLIGRGLTNKEIARELDLSISTVKHHVHNVLEKMQLPRRTHAMHAVRQQPWF